MSSEVPMRKAILAAIPIKPFDIGKARLAPRLDSVARSRLGEAVAAHTTAAAADAGALVAVVTADTGVAGWARKLGYLVIDETSAGGVGLNGAAEAAMFEAARRRRPWAVVHADLPLATPGVLGSVFAAASRETILVPSYDGGTNVIASSDASFPFSYGPSSFHRHLAARPQATVVPSPELALDLDSTADLDRVRQHKTGRWLGAYVP
jgi:2-phospho-L-lactate guanylyltransferase